MRRKAEFKSGRESFESLLMCRCILVRPTGHADLCRPIEIEFMSMAYCILFNANDQKAPESSHMMSVWKFLYV